MRILILSEFWPPRGGGLERAVQTTAHALVDRGHDVAVATTTPGPDDLRSHVVRPWSRVLRPFYRDAERPFLPPVPDPGLVRALHRVVDEEQPDVVHGHGWMLESYLAIAVGAPAVVATMHDYGAICPTRSLLRDGTALCSGPAAMRCLQCAGKHYGHGKGELVAISHRASRALTRRVDRFVAISEAVADAGARNGIARERIVVVPSPVDDDIGAGAPERPAFAPPGDYIVYVGALGPHKGTDVLLDAHHRLGARVPLLMIGKAEPPWRLPAEAAVYAVPKASHADVMAAFHHCRFAVVPSRWPEPFGLVAVEAMSRAKPVVATATGGLVDIVEDERNGLLVPPGDAAALARAIERLWNDRDLTLRLGENGRHHIQRFRATTVVEQLTKVYEDAIAARRRRTLEMPA